MAKISIKEVEKLAHLCKLKLTDEEAVKFKDELNEILGYVEQLQDIDVSNFEPTSQVTGLRNVTRPDVEVDYGVSAKELLSNAPEIVDNQFMVKRMIG